VVLNPKTGFENPNRVTPVYKWAKTRGVEIMMIGTEDLNTTDVYELGIPGIA
jgi:hypothetical protein